MKLAVVLLFVASGACGQTYKKPGDQSAQPKPTEGGAGAEQWDEPPASERATTGGSISSPSSGPAIPNAPTPTPAAPPASAGAGPAAQRWVDAHNRYRAKHCAAPLAWSPKVAEVAQTWADTLKNKGCVFGHSPGMKYGENLAAGTSGALDAEGSVAMWYDEVGKYTFPGGGFSMETGHFTQVAWTTTRYVGCGQVTCKGMDIYVCNYDPPGNVQGEYATHVLPTSCKK